MFSVIFPGQGSQLVGMGKDLHDKYKLIQDLFKEADDTLGFSLSKLVLNGPKEELDLTENTQPAIFLLSYSIFKLIKEEFKIDLNKANFFCRTLIRRVFSFNFSWIIIVFRYFEDIKN